MMYDRETLSVRVNYNSDMKVDTHIGKGEKNTTVSRPVGDYGTSFVGAKTPSGNRGSTFSHNIVTSYQNNLRSCITGIYMQ
jgi:hypothetical protein